jgi:hypothetical protein
MSDIRICRQLRPRLVQSQPRFAPFGEHKIASVFPHQIERDQTIHLRVEVILIWKKSYNFCHRDYINLDKNVLWQPATSTVDRAGAVAPKYFAQTSSIAAKSSMSFKKTVERTTLSRQLPACLRMAQRFFMIRSVCVAALPAITWWVTGSIATWPETKMNPFALIACE